MDRTVVVKPMPSAPAKRIQFDRVAFSPNWLLAMPVMYTQTTVNEI
jgi:hypothetical protein